MQQAPAAAPTLPFLLGSRLIWEKIGSKPFAIGGGIVDQELDAVGYGAGVLMHISGTVTVGTATLVFNGRQPFNLIMRAVLDTPGLSDPIAISGDSLKIQDLLGRFLTIDRGMVDLPQQGGAATQNAYDAANCVDLYPAIVATNTWSLWYFLPFVRNVRDYRGIVPLGYRGARTRVRLTPAAAADIATVPANITANNLTVDFYQAFYTAPPAGVETPDTSWAIVFDEYTQGIPSVGAQTIDLPVGGRILNIVHRVVINNAMDEADLGTQDLILNRDKILDGVDHMMWAKIQRERLMAPLPLGTIAYDREWAAADVPYNIGGELREKDWIYSDEPVPLNNMTSILRVNTGTTLGTVAQIVTTIKRLVRVQ